MLLLIVRGVLRAPHPDQHADLRDSWHAKHATLLDMLLLIVLDALLAPGWQGVLAWETVLDEKDGLPGAYR